MKFPFHYEISFRIINWDGDEISKTNEITQSFKNADPIIARNNAIEAFEEYVDFLRSNNRIRLCEYGRVENIQRPETATKLLNDLWEGVMSTDDLEILLEKKELYERNRDKFLEYIRLYLIIEDPKTADHHEMIYTDNFGVPELDHIIHEVSNDTSNNEQSIIDNLALIEVPLYRLNNLEIRNQIQTVYHYDYDYADSGEDEEDGARRDILPVPKKWATKAEYSDKMEKLNNGRSLEQENQIDEQHVDWLAVHLKKIIDEGESDYVEFKSSLGFDFRKKRQTYQIRYLNAKAICAFLNSKGGNLIVGVSDSRELLGLDSDYTDTGSDITDSLLIQSDNLIASFFSPEIKPLIHSKVVTLDDKTILWIRVGESPHPIFLRKMNKFPGEERSFDKEFYIRMSASTHCLKDVEQIITYIFTKNWKKDD